ncbi:MAG: hypothetical protein ABI254_04080 [Chthoniobacterales bacterium]
MTDLSKSRLFGALLLATIVSLCAPSIAMADSLYEIDSNGFAFKSSYLDVAFISSSIAGVWQLLDGHTIAKSTGYFPTTVHGLPDGVSLVSLSSSTSSDVYARGSDGFLYQIDSNGFLYQSSIWT